MVLGSTRPSSLQVNWSGKLEPIHPPSVVLVVDDDPVHGRLDSVAFVLVPVVSEDFPSLT